MPLLALNDLEHTHGTVQLIDHDGGLQTKNGIVLVPQPNKHDPNDPLMWSAPKRYAALYSVLFFSLLCNFCITGLAPGFGQLEAEFKVSITDLTYLISVAVLGEGMGCFTIAPLAQKIGKRPIWLSTVIVFFFCNIWASCAQSYPSLLVARLLATWAAGTSEPMSVATINDLFFLHERGQQSGVQGIWLTFGSSFAPVICGYLIQSAGWRWYHWLVTILAGINVVLIFFFFPETQYTRDLHKSMDITHAQNHSDLVEPKLSESKALGVEIEELYLHKTKTNRPGRVYVKKSFLQDIKPWSGVDSNVSVIGSLVRPWACWLYPSMVWAVLAFSIHVACVVVLLSLLPLYISLPPYNFSSGQQGLTYLSSVVFVILGALLGGHCNDYLSRRLARRNNGVFEPEMRFPVIIFPMIVVPIGLVLFGVGIDHQWHWIVPVVGAGMVNFGLPAIPGMFSPYIMDAYYPIVMDASILFNGFKNFVSFGVGFAVIPWITTNGLVTVFCILAALVFVIDGSVLVIYIYGKRLRKADSHKKILLF